LLANQRGLLRTVQRPRRYLAAHWLVLLAPFFRYSYGRDAYVLRAVGDRVGPVLRHDRRATRRARHAASGGSVTPF
jgi:hypothetical protein